MTNQTKAQDKRFCVVMTDWNLPNFEQEQTFIEDEALSPQDH